MVRGLLLLGRNPAEASDVGKGGPRRWMLYLLLLMALSVVVLWKSVRVSGATELAFFVGFFVFSAAAGLAEPAGGRGGDRAIQGMPGIPEQGLIPKRRHKAPTAPLSTQVLNAPNKTAARVGAEDRSRDAKR